MTRKCRRFWAAHEGAVTEVTGFECAGDAAAWWVPSLGYTMHEGFHLFDSEADARAEVEKSLRATIATAEKKLSALARARGEVEP